MAKKKVISTANKDYTVEDIKELLKTNKTAQVVGLLRIFEKQTAYEQSAETTSENNGVGFNGLDAPFACSVAKRVSKFGIGLNMDRELIREILYNNYVLSAKQYEVLKKIMPKYAKQIFNQVYNAAAA